MEYYELKIQIDDFIEETIKYELQDMTEYQNRLSYLSFNMQKDLTMKVNDNKLAPCKLYHYERTYGLAPYTKVLIGFSKEDIGESTLERTIILNDRLFNKGLIKFNYSSSTLLEIPKIAVFHSWVESRRSRALSMIEKFSGSSFDKRGLLWPVSLA